MPQVRELHVWSTPDRRLGNKILDPIPTEIYLEILSYFVIAESYNESPTRKILCRLGLVCRFFRSVSLPMVFNSIYIRRHPPDFTPFLLSVYRGDDPISLNLCQYVQQCTTFVDLESPAIPFEQSSSTTPAGAPLFGDLICHVARKTPKISTFRLFHAEITPRLLKTLSSLSKLTSLNLCGIKFSKAISKMDLKAFASSVQLESLELYGLGTNVPDLIPLATQPQLTHLSTDWTFVRALAAAEVVASLHHLNICNVEDLKVLHSFLLRTPTLVSLQIDMADWPERDDANRTGWLTGLLALKDGSYPLPLSPFSNLRRLECPLHLAYLFSGPHSLQFICFNRDMYSSVPEEELELSSNATLLLRSVNPSLREIEFWYNQDRFVLGKSDRKDSKESWYGNLRHWFPCLTRLAFELPTHFEADLCLDQRLEEMKKDFSSFLEAWGPMDTLISLRVANIQTEDIDAFRGLIAKEFDLEKHFPSLAFFEVRFESIRRNIQ